jgi:LCP family protein required for cell wall assembly
MLASNSGLLGTIESDILNAAMSTIPPKSFQIQRWLLPVLIVLAVIVGLQFWMNARLSHSMALIADNNAQMIDDVGQANQLVSQFGGDLNEVRRLLLMPTKEYQFESFTSTEESGDVIEADPIVTLFEAIEKLGAEESYKQRYTKNKDNLDIYLNQEETLTYLKNKGFYLRNGLQHEVITEQGETRITIDYNDLGNLRITPLGGGVIEFNEPDSFEKFKETFRAVVERIPASEKTSETIEETTLNIFKEKVDQLRASIEALKEDEGFQSTLRNAHLQFSFEARETDQIIEYDIMNPEGKPIRILYINKATGELMMRDPGEDVGSLLNNAAITDSEMLVLPSILTFDSRDEKKEKDFNILVAGKHDWNVDTIMLANVDTRNEKVTLLSIPRDLYYNGRKINSIYADYGMAEMARQLSDITGQRIDQYILVDMYVFSDLIDLVGGVTINLEEDLVDPTYKVVENGKKGTLFYPAGEHHIDGTEALRISRSRYSTSDYSRAKRQQIILDGLLHKARELGFGDAPTALKLIKKVIQKTDTNIEIKEAAEYFFRYQDYELNRGSVLSSGNVLDSVPIPLDNIETSLKVNVCNTVGDEEVCEIKSAIYTLQPREGNWDYIKWYIQELLRG